VFAVFAVILAAVAAQQGDVPPPKDLGYPPDTGYPPDYEPPLYDDSYPKYDPYPKHDSYKPAPYDSVPYDVPVPYEGPGPVPYEGPGPVPYEGPGPVPYEGPGPVPYEGPGPVPYEGSVLPPAGYGPSYGYGYSDVLKSLTHTVMTRIATQKSQIASIIEFRENTLHSINKLSVAVDGWCRGQYRH